MEVTVLMELLRRFDEQNNIQWAERMEEAGCTILYGTEGFKVHSKICLITRRERGKIQYITQVGTGNYNEKTAKQYTDLCLMTARPELGEDAAVLFRNMAIANLNGDYKQLLVSPFQLRDKVMELMDREIKKGPEGYIFLKLNSITDRKLIDKLAQASQAGVEVVMNVRGICCIRPGIPGLTDHITIFSIVGRYLEHTRIYRFGRGDNADLFISSADFMTRNTERGWRWPAPCWTPRCAAPSSISATCWCPTTSRPASLAPTDSGVPARPAPLPAPARMCSWRRVWAPPTRSPLPGLPSARRVC